MDVKSIILFASNRKTLSGVTYLNIVFQVHSAAVISKPHKFFQDMYNIDNFIANCKTNNHYAS